jgi:hypothetical protein
VASSLQHSVGYLLSIKRKYFLVYIKDYPLLDEDPARGRQNKTDYINYRVVSMFVNLDIPNFDLPV